MILSLIFFSVALFGSSWIIFIALKEIMTYNKDDETQGLLNKIFLLGRMGNFYPLVITCWIKFKNEPELLNQILKTVEKFVFRAYVKTVYQPNLV